MAGSTGIDQDAIDELSAALRALGLRTEQRSSAGSVLKVTNPRAARMEENVIYCRGGFYWPWRGLIGRADDIPGTADVIARVLACAP